MAEIGHLLLLPPPGVPGRTALARAGAGRGTGADDSQNGAQNITAAVEETGDATSNAPSNSRGKQFRFRVLDGGRSDSLAGNAGVPARADPNAEGTREQAAPSGAQATHNRRAGDSGAGSVPLGTARATFLAQLIAQEQLPQGLYNPPIKTADRAYRQAGGEPALSDGNTSTARFRIAV
jgi:hypothetical protein